MKTFKRKGLGKWFGHFWFLKEFLEVVPCGITQGWVSLSTWPHETQRNIYTIVSILACFDEGMAKKWFLLWRYKCQRNTFDHKNESSCKGGQIAIFIFHIGNEFVQKFITWKKFLNMCCHCNSNYISNFKKSHCHRARCPLWVDEIYHKNKCHV